MQLIGKETVGRWSNLREMKPAACTMPPCSDGQQISEPYDFMASQSV